MRPTLFLALTCLVLLFPSMGRSQTPTVVQHVDLNFAETNTQTPRNGTFYVVGRTVPLPNVTGAGNCIVVAVIAKSTASTLPTVTDDKGNTYTQITHQQDSANSTDMTVFVALNITDGARIITVAWPSGHNTGCTAIKVTEFNNVTAVDASNTAQTNSPIITSGSVTPAFANDLLYMVGWQDASSSIFAPGSLFGLVGQSNITWQFIPCSTQGVDGSFAVYGQYNSTAAIAPQVTVSGSTTYNYLTTTLALTTGLRGTAPGPGIRVVGAQHIFSVADGDLTTQFVTQGNLQVNLSDGPAGGVAMTSTGANTAPWVSRVVASNPNGAGGQILDSVNTIPGIQTLTIIQGSGSGSRSSSYILLDIAGAAASPYDTSTGNNTGYSNSPTSFAASSITPRATNELLVNISGNQYQTVTTMQGGTGYNSLCSYETPVPGEEGTLQDYSESDNNDAFGIIYATSAVPYSFTYNLYDNDSSVESGVEYFGSAAVAYRSATQSQSVLGSTATGGGGSGGGGGCFIATAAFGSYQEGHVRILRQFRDTFLLTNIPGKALVKWYYRHSPKYAAIIAGRPSLRAMARTALLPVYGVAVLSLSGLLVPLTLIIPCAVLSFLLCTGKRRRRSPKVPGRGADIPRK